MIIREKMTFVSLMFLFPLVFLVSCSNDTKFNLSKETNSFRQNLPEKTKSIDILWVIDNSGTMENLQKRLADNFNFFIDKFLEKNLDFQMAVTTTDAYNDLFAQDPNGGSYNLSNLKDGNLIQGPSGYSIVNQSTPNLKNVFLKNILQGSSGDGDERPFQSIFATLENPNNSKFYREGSFLAIIIVSDEDDFSKDGSIPLWEDPGSSLHSIEKYTTYLEEKTNSHFPVRTFNVSSISIPDKDCLNQLKDPGGGKMVGKRLMEIAKRTDGVPASLCESFSKLLSSVSGKILSLLTQFYLKRIPQASTITVFIDGVTVVRDEKNGWSYNSRENSIVFHGDAVPRQGAHILVEYIPTTARP